MLQTNFCIVIDEWRIRHLYSLNEMKCPVNIFIQLFRFLFHHAE